MPLKPGDRIERYVIDGLLGSGGMGDVYRAHDPRLKRGIALKILHAEPGADPGKSSPASGASARMVREAQLAAALDHPNVVAIFDVGQIEQPEELRGTTYLAMELIRGEPLRKFIGDPSVRMSKRVRWLEDIARALGAAHAAGLVHRDVKPENVMIREDGLVKVLDFGIAKRTVTMSVASATSSTEGYVIPTMTAQGIVVGTPMYMAPEQVRAETLDGRADQFAWGVLAYELLTGKALWSLEGGGFSLVAQILQAAAPSLAGAPGVTERVAGVVARALEKNRGDRFATMGALIGELTGKVEGEDTEPKIPLSASSPDLEEQRKLSEAPTEYAKVERVSAPALSEGSTQRSAVEEEPQATTRRSSRPPGPGAASRRTVAGVAALVAIGAVVGGGAWRARRSATPATVASTSPGAAATPSCTSNRECVEAHRGDAWVCRTSDHRCSALASEDCTVLADDRALKNDATVWVGTLFPLKGEIGLDYGVANAQAVDLARRDVSEAAHAIASIRPFGVVSCDDTAAPDRAARHLVSDVEVPAVIGFASSAEAVDLAGSILLPSQTLTIAALNMSPVVTTVPSAPGAPRLVWRTTYNIADTAAPLAALVSGVLEPRMRDRLHGAAVRVVVARRSGAGALAFAGAVFRHLVFNGKSALDNGGNYREVVIDDQAGLDSSVTQIAEFAPSIVFAQGEEHTALVEALEKSWRSSKPRPFYLVPGLFGGPRAAEVLKDPDARRRLFGVTTVSATPENARFVIHFNEVFGMNVTRAASPNTSYDAFYAIALASFALDGPVTGSSLARAFDRFEPPGEAIDVGPGSVLEAYSALRDGRHIDANGASGKLRFDAVTGERPADFSILCVALGDDDKAVENRDSGTVYDALTRRLVGALRCP